MQYYKLGNTLSVKFYSVREIRDIFLKYNQKGRAPFD